MGCMSQAERGEIPLKGKTAFWFVALLAAIALYAGTHWSEVKRFAADTLHTGAANARETSGKIKTEVEGEAAVLIDAQTGRTLFGKNADKRLYPASTTKIMTALIALEHGKLDDQIRVGDEIELRTLGESSAGLVQGERLSLRDLLAAMMLPSGNDAARTVARYVVRTSTGKEVSAQEAIRKFAEMMNERAAQIGAQHTRFVNPHGLHDPKHYTTASDMALIAKEAMNNEVFRDVVGEPEHVTTAASKKRTFVNRNQLLQPDGTFYVQSVNGVKTGFTDEAGYCLVSSAESGGKRLIAVVLKSTANGVWTDSQQLLRLGFKEVGSNRT